MSVKVKQEDGTEIEAFTAEELAAQVEAKSKEASEAAVAAEAERLKAEHESVLLEKEEALADAQEKLRKAEEKVGNFKALREKAENGGKEEAKKVSDEVRALKETVDAIQKQPFESAKVNFVKQNIGADKDLAEKHEFFFKKLSVGAKTVEEYNTALESAMTLATGKPFQGNGNSMVRTSVNENFAGTERKAESQDSINFGTLLGVTPDDKKAYAGKSGLELLKPTPLKEAK